MNRKILYISYDGMTDPLGQSQVIPYLAGLAKAGYQFTILSFEKKDRYEKLKDSIEAIMQQAGIVWVPMRFTRRPPLLSKFYDAIRMQRKAFSLFRKHKFDMIHCRSYVAANLGLQLKRKKGAKFFFDMRGFWADEKKEGGSWKQTSFLFRKVYQHYKKKEAQFISEADHIISLTEAGKAEMIKWPSYNPDIPISVIPCCSDMDHFTLTSATDKIKGRQLLGLPGDKLIISYLGSIGTWYMLDEMLQLFSVIKEKYSGAKFLFITHSSPALILSKLTKFKIAEEDVIIIEASRQEVPAFTKASDINISFIRPVYSKLSSSPTKLGEVLAMGIPVIVNSGVGDVRTIVESTHSGIVINQFCEEEYKTIVEGIDLLLNINPYRIRAAAKDIYSLEIGIAAYKKAYEKTLN